MRLNIQLYLYQCFRGGIIEPFEGVFATKKFFLRLEIILQLYPADNIGIICRKAYPDLYFSEKGVQSVLSSS